MLGIDAERFDNAAFADLVGESFAHSLRNALTKARDPRRPGLLFNRRLEGSQISLDVSVHAFDNHAIVEFEPPPRRRPTRSTSPAASSRAPIRSASCRTCSPSRRGWCAPCSATTA